MTKFEPAVVIVFNNDLSEFEVYNPEGDRVTDQVKETLLVVGMGLTDKETGETHQGVFIGAKAPVEEEVT